MAFKATRKPSLAKKTTKTSEKTSKTEEQPKPPSVATETFVEMPATVHEPDASSPGLSLEDLVGAPQGATAVSTPTSSGSTDHPAFVRAPSMGSNRSGYQGAQQGGRRDFRSSGTRNRFDRGGNRGGYSRDRGSDRFGRDFNRGSGGFSGGYRRDEGFAAQGGPASGWDRAPRRDFGENAGAPSFTQDVDVPTETVRGVLDTMPDGHGFLRPKYTPSERDVYISQSQIRRFLLRNGDMVEGQARQPKDNERYWGLLKVEKVNDLPAEQMEKRPRFEDLVPVYPNKLLRLETGVAPLSTRILDLLCPIGFGQRGLVVSPPKAGKTTILKELAAGISANYPEVHLMAVLIGERPEEVTDISRSVQGEVYASNFDESPEHQTRVAEVALDRAKRLIEMGHDVVILLDSITRLARAYNLVVNPSGRTLTGGFDPAALYPAKKFLGAARCNEPFVTPEEEAKTAEGEKPVLKRITDGGSLTIIGTALIETGSRMDDLIYEEFKGTGNMELHLSRSLQERRIFPAIDVGKSGTRHDELLLGEDIMKKVTTLRHMLSMLSDEERTQMLIDRLGKTKDNAEFLLSLAQG